LPDELKSDLEPDTLLHRIHKIFNGLYVDTPTKFSSHSFYTEEERQEFLSALLLSVKLLRERYGDRYRIICEYDENCFHVEPGHNTT